ncbi:MAG: hypothetical protein WD069_02490 [Planctomycetales bacterium]
MNSVILRNTANAVLAVAAASYGTLPAHAGGLFGHHRHCGCDSGHCGACGCAADGWGGGYGTGGYGPGGYAAGSFGGLAASPAPWPHPPGAGPGPMLRPPLPLVVPPPGTLGRTYQQPSRPIPLNMHPRMAMLEVRGVADAEVTVAGLKGFKGTDGVWVFETEKPLVPGNPFIHEVRAKRVSDGGVADDLRVVRLIPDRIVTLDY